MRTIEGIYRNGRVELRQRPAGEDNTRVLVTFTGEPVDGFSAPPASATDPSAVSQPLPDGPERDAAVEEILSGMDVGLDFGAAPPLTREEIYDERVDELERRRRENR